MTATDLKKRAIALAEKTKIDSVTPEEVGQLSNDIVEYIENVEINGSSLGIRKTYTSVSAMEADSTAPKDDKGVLLRRGMLVNIYNQSDPESADNGKVFSFQNPGWAFRGTVDAGYATKEELTELDNKSSYQSVSMVMNTGGSGAAYIGETLKKDWGDDVLLTINQWNISNKDIRFSYHVDGNEEQKIKILSIDGPGNYIVNFEGKPTDIRPYVLASEIEMEGEVNITLYDRLGTMQYINSLDIVNNTNEINTLKEDVSLTNTIINGGGDYRFKYYGKGFDK